ncbi:MAG: ABC transporter ATP-binding protein [Bacillota bacterium]|nr:ABC transporter ATP-binding protein [Bacillota bacterium]
MIRAEKVSAAYGTEVIIKELSLQIDPHQFVVVVGPNGSGKSTLLKGLNGLAKVEGNLWINGQELRDSNLMELRREIAYVPQHWPVDPRTPLSVEDLILSGRCGKKGLLKPYSRKDHEEARRVAQDLSIEHLFNRPVGKLSGGEFQKATIARAIFQEPILFLLDEPTSSLDWDAGRELVDWVYQLHIEKHLTTLMVTHELNMIPPFADTIMVMRQGQIVASGSYDEILNKEVLKNILGWEL